MALSANGCAAASASRAGIKRPIEIKGRCEDPPFALADGLIWTRPPCTLIVRYER